MNKSLVWDDSQRFALHAAVGGGNVVVVGAPGSGKTSLAVEAAALGVEQGGNAPEGVLLLASDRRAAAGLRDRLTVRLGRTLRGTMVRSVASAAYSIIAHQCRMEGVPLPELATGPEQDADLAALLAGHASGEGVPVPWPASIPPEVWGLAGFRGELRDLLMRCAERGVGPRDLARLGRTWHRPEWVAAAAVYSEYLDVTTMSRQTPDVGPRYDAATLVDVAAETVRQWVDLDERQRLQWSLVIVDDYQDATAATARLLRELVRDGAQIVLLGDPDQAVQGFRGGRPDLLGRAAAPMSAGGGFDGEFSATEVVLRSTWRQNTELLTVVNRIVQHIGTAAGVAHRAALRPESDVTDGSAQHISVAGEQPTARAEALGSTEEQGGAEAPARWRGDRAAGASSVERFHARSVVEEHGIVARLLRAEHLLAGTPWSQVAVIARTSEQVMALRRALAAAGVPVSGMGAELPLRSEPAVRPLLTLIESAANASWDDAILVDLLNSPYGGLDALRLRRLRRALLRHERASGGNRQSEELLVELLTHQAGRTLPDLPGGVGIQRIAEMIIAAREAAATGLDPHSTLWAVWNAAQVASEWQNRASGSGAAAQRADADLDAVLAAFREAEVYTERHVAASASQFVEWLLGLSIPADSLAARARPGGTVSVVSPAQAAGHEWDVVVISGVQDGTWPDLRLRDSLLGAQVLADIVDGRGSGADPRAARRAVLDDELRLLAVAVSRARRRLVVTATDNEDAQPSVFCSLICPVSDELQTPDEPVVGSAASAPLDLRGLVMEARAGLARAGLARAAAHPADDSQSKSETRREPQPALAKGRMPKPAVPPAIEAWGGLLADLARAGVKEADPQWWYAVAEPSSTSPLSPPDQPVAVSPSKVASVHSCALRWAVEAADGTGQEHVVAGLGTLIHAIARDLPTADTPQLAEELARRWPELALSEGWPSMQLRRQAEEMVRRLGEFQRHAGPPAAVEQSFDVTVGRARLRGSIDRVDHTTSGLKVTDFKTGKTPLTVAAADVDPQLASYQVAITRLVTAEHPAADAQNLESAADEDQPDMEALGRADGAELVYLGAGTRGPTTRTQPALADFENPHWAESMISEAAEIMAAAQFWATPNQGCSHCPVRRSCPVQPDGRMVLPPQVAPDEDMQRAPLSSFSTAEVRTTQAHGGASEADQR